MFETCRACLKSLNVITSPYFQFDNKTLSDDERDKFNTVVPEMDLNIPNQIFFCETCHSSLQSAYKFKTQCLETEKMIKKYLDSKCVINLEDFDLKAVSFECSDINVKTSDETVLYNDSEVKSPILSELLNSVQFDDFNNELGIKEESENITVVNHEVGNFFSNKEEVVPAKNNVLYPDNNKVKKKSVLLALLQGNNNNYNQTQPSNINNSNSMKNNLHPVIHNNIHNEIQNNQYNNQNNYFIINNTNLSQIRPVIQDSIYNGNNHNVGMQNYDKHSQLSINQNYIENPFITSNRNLSQIDQIFQNIPNHYIYKKRRLETNIYNVNDNSTLKPIEIDLTDVSSEENVTTESVTNNYINNNTLHFPEHVLTESFQNKDFSLPILKDIIDPQSLDPGPVQPDDVYSSKKPDTLSGVQVIPHLKKFFVCDICGKLLSTRFYAFHMKKHK